MKSAAESIIGVGLALKCQMERLFKEDFERWVRDECKISRTTAYRMMKVARDVGGKIPSMGLSQSLGTTALELLVSSNTPQEIRDRVESLLVDGQKVTVADIRKMKAANVIVGILHNGQEDTLRRLGRSPSELECRRSVHAYFSKCRIIRYLS